MPLPVTKNPLDVESLNLDDPDERSAFYNALTDIGCAETGKRLRAMRDSGIIDADGNRISSAIPPDMLDRERGGVTTLCPNAGTRRRM